MKKILLVSAAVAAAGIAGAYALTHTLKVSEPVQKQITVKKMPVKMTTANKILNPSLYEPGRRPAPAAGYVLKEDFEGWNGTDPSWLPEGWTVERKVSATNHKGWTIYAPASGYDAISSKCMVFNYFDDPVDEWLITPEVTVAPGMQLVWQTLPSPAYYFDWDYIDWSTGLLSEMHVLNDVKVHISEDGGENWTELMSLADLYKDNNNIYQLFLMMQEAYFTIDLRDYAGKNVKVAFQVTGEPEGNSALVDNVSIGLPPLDLSYAAPAGSLFFGLSANDEYLPASIKVGPVYTPVSYNNQSKNNGATYSWSYVDSEGEKTSDEQFALSITYLPDYTSDFTTRNNLYDMPVLHGSSETNAPGEFSLPYLFQAGGKGEYERHYVDTDEKEIIDLGLSLMDPMTEGMATYADITVPYFGYNQESDRYWSRYTFGDDNDIDENNYNHLLKYGNLFTAGDTPMVINGVRANGYGRLSRNAEFKAEIYLLGRDYRIPDQPYATAVCTGEDITIIDRNASNNILSFDFKFDEPIVMSKELTPYYLIAISGFHDAENVEYFSPEMSAVGNGSRLNLGWIGMQACFMGEMIPMSWSDVYTFVGDFVAFYIMLDAEFPWLEAENGTVTLIKNQTATVALDSYYDGSNLTLEGVPDWIDASLSGRFGDAKLTLTSTSSTAGEATIVMKGPGVEKSVQVSNTASSGLSAIESDAILSSDVLFTLTGVRVKGEPAPGIYIVKRGDGKVFKTVIR